MGWNLTDGLRRLASSTAATGRTGWRSLARAMERLAHSDPLAVFHSFRRHPFLISAPLAALASGAGIGANALLRPGTSAAEGELLDTLIASP